MDETTKRWINLSHGMEGHPDQNTDQRTTENGILLYVQYLLLKLDANKLTINDVNQFKIIVNNLRTYDEDGNQIDGLYDRGQGESLKGHKWYVEPEERRTISHDNLTAISVMSYVLAKKGYDTEFHKHICSYMWRNLFTINNRYPNKISSKILHPRDMIFYTLLGGNLIQRMLFKLFLPLLVLIQIESVTSKYRVTSGKLLYLVRKHVNGIGATWTITKLICDTILKITYKNNPWQKITSIYYSEYDMPVRKLARELEI
jgi:hypothetical protein